MILLEIYSFYLFFAKIDFCTVGELLFLLNLCKIKFWHFVLFWLGARRSGWLLVLWVADIKAKPHNDDSRRWP